MSSEPPLNEGGLPAALAYASRRRRLEEAVHVAVNCNLGDAARVIGSWRASEFHLAANASVSFGDVDIFDPEHLRHEEYTWAVATAEDRLILRVSIHPYNYEDALRPHGRLALALLNLAAAGRTSAPVGYVCAKAYLVLASSGRASSYRAMASTVGCGMEALQVKLGLLAPEIVASKEEFWVALTNAAQSARAALVPAGSPRDLVTLLKDTKCGIEPAFGQYLADKFGRLKVVSL